MPEPSTKPDPLAWLKWLWKSTIGTGVLFMVAAVLSRDLSIGLAAVGVIITGLADYVDRRNRRLRWALVGAGLILTAVGIYLSFKHPHAWDFLAKS